ncbi:hypothetical protein VCR12J2_1060105 [Vibrio coralliirubri]|nr:hypothetical protein VCR12J2_1060105 [Vibrio coralliirubri]
MTRQTAGEWKGNLDANTSQGSFIINEPTLSEFIGKLKPTE